MKGNRDRQAAREGREPPQDKKLGATKKAVTFKAQVDVHVAPNRSLSPVVRGKKSLDLTAEQDSLQNQVISKDEFKSLDINDISLRVVDYSYSLVSHTEYEVQISIRGQRNYLKSTRYRHLEAFDHVLREKFKNLEFPRLPDKKIFRLKKEKERKQYLQAVLDQILTYSARFPNLKSQLLSFLYNLLLKGDLQVLKAEDVKHANKPLAGAAQFTITQLMTSRETESRHGTFNGPTTHNSAVTTDN